MNRKLIYHVLYNLFYVVGFLGLFEQMLDLQNVAESKFHWFWSTYFPFIPHHVWWGFIGVYITYLLLNKNDFYELRKTLISMIGQG